MEIQDLGRQIMSERILNNNQSVIAYNLLSKFFLENNEENLKTYMETKYGAKVLKEGFSSWKREFWYGAINLRLHIDFENRELNSYNLNLEDYNHALVILAVLTDPNFQTLPDGFLEICTPNSFGILHFIIQFKTTPEIVLKIARKAKDRDSFNRTTTCLPIRYYFEIFEKAMETLEHENLLKNLGFYDITPVVDEDYKLDTDTFSVYTYQLFSSSFYKDETIMSNFTATSQRRAIVKEEIYITVLSVLEDLETARIRNIIRKFFETCNEAFNISPVKLITRFNYTNENVWKVVLSRTFDKTLTGEHCFTEKHNYSTVLSECFEIPKKIQRLIFTYVYPYLEDILKKERINGEKLLHRNSVILNFFHLLDEVQSSSILSLIKKYGSDLVRISFIKLNSFKIDYMFQYDHYNSNNSYSVTKRTTLIDDKVFTCVEIELEKKTPIEYAVIKIGIFDSFSEPAFAFIKVNTIAELPVEEFIQTTISFFDIITRNIKNFLTESGLITGSSSNIELNSTLENKIQVQISYELSTQISTYINFLKAFVENMTEKNLYKSSYDEDFRRVLLVIKRLEWIAQNVYNITFANTYNYELLDRYEEENLDSYNLSNYGEEY
jgi:hypothetical protein